MIAYIVYSPDEKVIGFYNEEQVLEYVDEYYGKTMTTYGKEQGLDIDEFSAKNVEDAATIMGATEGSCRVYAIEDVLQAIRKTSLPRETQASILELLSSSEIDFEIDCPTDLYEILLEMNEVNLAQMISDYTDEDRP